jgi:integrase
MIYKRKESTSKPFVCRLECGFDAKGKRQYRCKSFRTEGEAKKWQTKQDAEKLDTGAFYEPSQQLLGAYLADWIDARINWRDRTRNGNRRLLARYVQRHPIAGIPLARLTTTHLEQHGRRLSAEKLSPRTVRLVLSLLSTALQKAVRDKLIRSNPATGVELPEQWPERARWYEAGEVAHLVATSEATGNRWDALWVLLVATGLRPSEALASKWSDVSEDRVQVRGTLVREGGGWTVTKPKTPESERVVKLQPMAVLALRKHRQRQLEERMKAGPAYQANDFVFAGQTGQPLDLRNIAARHFKPLLKAAGLPDIRVYDLRHTFASNLYAETKDALLVAKILEHKSPMMVLTRYAHVLKGQEDEAMDRLAARIAAAREA